MIRITFMSGRYYGKKISSLNYKELEDINIFVNEGTPVILVDELESLENSGIDPDDVEMVS
jgi:hypothetical protein